MNRRWTILLLAAAFSTAVVGCGSDPSTDGSEDGGSTTVTVAHVPANLFAPLYVAIDKGYFADEGIAVKLERIQAGQDAIALTSAGRIDVVVAGFSAAMFSAVDRGIEFDVVGSMAAVPEEGTPSAFVISKQLLDSGEVEDISDLEGRKVAVAGGEGSAGAYLVDLALQKGGLTLNDVEVVPLELGDAINALDTGAVAAAYPSEPFTSAIVEEGTAEVVATPPPGTVSTGVIYGQQFAESQAARPFFTALVRGAQDMQGEQKKSEENLRILAEYTGQEISVLKDIPSYAWDPNLSPTDTETVRLETTLNSMQDTYQELGVVNYKQDIPPSEYMDSSYSEEAASEVK